MDVVLGECSRLAKSIYFSKGLSLLKIWYLQLFYSAFVTDIVPVTPLTVSSALYAFIYLCFRMKFCRTEVAQKSHTGCENERVI
jgi:hypothetical protein